MNEIVDWDEAVRSIASFELVIVEGVDGVGKTRLASEVAAVNGALVVSSDHFYAGQRPGGTLSVSTKAR
jgi:thymidylate kinase